MSKRYSTVRITPTCFNGTTGAVDEVVFNPTKIPLASLGRGKALALDSLVLVDYDDNSGMKMDFYFFQKGTNDIGDLGGVIDITDDELKANKVLGRAQLSSVSDGAIGDMILSRIYTGTRTASTNGLGLILQPEIDSADIYVAAVCQASMVSTTSGMELIFGFSHQ